jgi:hypothetical protein
VDLDLPGWLQSLRGLWNSFWTQILGQQPADPFHIPFVDFARGDGMKVGPGHTRKWVATVIDEGVSWVSQYRGLWGLFARDPISGENAPAGPMYNRDGSPRNSWYDPLGFAGLDKVAPPNEVSGLLEKNRSDVTDRQTSLATLMEDKADQLQSLGTKQRSTEGNPHLAKQDAALQKQMTVLADELRGLRREHSENAALLEGLVRELEWTRRGLRDDARAHIHHLIMPDKTAGRRFQRLGETWAAISLSVLLFGIVLMLVVAPRFLGAGLAVITLLFVVLESVLRRAFIHTVSELTALLALIASLILLVHFWHWILIGVLLAVATFLLFQRVHELTG